MREREKNIPTRYRYKERYANSHDYLNSMPVINLIFYTNRIKFISIDFSGKEALKFGSEVFLRNKRLNLSCLLSIHKYKDI